MRKNRKLFYQNMVFNFFLDHIVDKQGHEVKEYFVMQPKQVTGELGGGVAIMPIFENKIGMVKIYRPAIDASVWEVPHGFVENEEAENEAVARELKEEAGIVISADECVSLGFVAPDAGVIAARVHLFFAEVGDVRVKPVRELGIEEFRFFSADEVKSMVMESEIQDSFSIVSIFRYLSLRGRVNWQFS